MRKSKRASRGSSSPPPICLPHRTRSSRARAGAQSAELAAGCGRRHAAAARQAAPPSSRRQRRAAGRSSCAAETLCAPARVAPPPAMETRAPLGRLVAAEPVPGAPTRARCASAAPRRAPTSRCRRSPTSRAGENPTFMVPYPCRRARREGDRRGPCWRRGARRRRCARTCSSRLPGALSQRPQPPSRRVLLVGDGASRVLARLRRLDAARANTRRRQTNGCRRSRRQSEQQPSSLAHRAPRRSRWRTRPVRTSPAHAPSRQSSLRRAASACTLSAAARREAEQRTPRRVPPAQPTADGRSCGREPHRRIGRTLPRVPAARRPRAGSRGRRRASTTTS